MKRFYFASFARTTCCQVEEKVHAKIAKIKIAKSAKKLIIKVI
jgi:hypothetical protein